MNSSWILLIPLSVEGDPMKSPSGLALFVALAGWIWCPRLTAKDDADILTGDLLMDLAINIWDLWLDLLGKMERSNRNLMGIWWRRLTVGVIVDIPWYTELLFLGLVNQHISMRRHHLAVVCSNCFQWSTQVRRTWTHTQWRTLLVLGNSLGTHQVPTETI